MRRKYPPTNAQTPNNNQAASLANIYINRSGAGFCYFLLSLERCFLYGILLARARHSVCVCIYCCSRHSLCFHFCTHTHTRAAALDDSWSLYNSLSHTPHHTYVRPLSNTSIIDSMPTQGAEKGRKWYLCPSTQFRWVDVVLTTEHPNNANWTLTMRSDNNDFILDRSILYSQFGIVVCAPPLLLICFWYAVCFIFALSLSQRVSFSRAILFYLEHALSSPKYFITTFASLISVISFIQSFVTHRFDCA